MSLEGRWITETHDGRRDIVGRAHDTPEEWFDSLPKYIKKQIAPGYELFRFVLRK